MKLTKISAENFRAIKLEMERAIETIGLKYGIANSITRGAYNSSEAEFKINFKTTEGENRQNASVNYILSTFGLKIGDRVKSSKNGMLTVVGYNKRAHQYPIKLQTLDGKGIKANVDFCRANLIK